MKTIRKVIKEVVDQELENRGLLTGDLSEVISDKVWAAVQERKARRGDACPHEWINAIMRLCKANSYTASSALRSQISECGKALIQSGADLNDLEEFSKWWKTDTWRAKNIPSPTPMQIRDSWGKFKGESISGPLVIK